MKTNYLPRSRDRHSFGKKVVFLLGVFLIGGGVLYFLTPVIVRVAAPLSHSENTLVRPFVSTYNFFRSKQVLISENNLLKNRISSLEVELSVLSSRSRYEELLASLGRNNNVSSVIASVLVRPPESPYDLLVVDVGSRDGVSLGSKVSMPEGPELGVVTEVFSKQARVSLFSSNGVKTNAVLERHGVPVVLEGVGLGNFHMVVPREIDVVVGDKILSSSIGSDLVAVVGDVIVEPTSSSKKVLAQSPLNIFSVRFVEVEL